ncbi:PEP-utilizing enzyme [Bacteriovoracales bacterium]|nr:PEP-utilizing enzyme [Bacteriovoracales bacterium]
MDTNKLIIHLEDTFDEDLSLIGAKAKNLASVHKQGYKIPSGFSLTTYAYDLFLKENNLKEKIFSEIHRKPIKKMRWEEIWDASLRIRSNFLQGNFPKEITEILQKVLKKEDFEQGLSIRSSALKEDQRLTSFAGIYETLLNIKTLEEVQKSIKIVWASLWSDASLLYKKELSLNIENSKMAVLLQRMVKKSCSGVVFSEAPNGNKKNQCLIEVVPGECRNLVDGLINPEQFFINKENSKITSSSSELLNDNDLINLLQVSKTLERNFGFPVDIEWSGKGEDLHILQVRPITSGSLFKNDAKKFWFLKLRPKKKQLKNLAKKVESELIPLIKKIGEHLSKEKLEDQGPEDLQKSLEERFNELKKWQDIYKNKFIPFAHGVRQLGQYYNDSVCPKDPFEFTGLLEFDDLIAIKRNKSIKKLTNHLKKWPSLKNALVELVNNHNEPLNFKKLISNEGGEDFLNSYFELKENYLDFVFDFSRIIDRNDLLAHHLIELIEKEDDAPSAKKEISKALELKLLQAVGKNRESEAREIIELARLSWKIRDDDNLLLSKIEAQLLRAIYCGFSLLDFKPEIDLKNLPLGDLVSCLSEALLDKSKINDLQNKIKGLASHINNKKKNSVQAFQLVGQPAAPGIVSGDVKIVLTIEDLGNFKKGDILVCQAIQPQMTHLLPLATAIIEQRGGMLIHGALLAREFCIPCVNGIPEIFEQVKNGDFVTVDGHLGLVTIGTPDI